MYVVYDEFCCIIPDVIFIRFIAEKGIAKMKDDDIEKLFESMKEEFKLIYRKEQEKKKETAEKAARTRLHTTVAKYNEAREKWLEAKKERRNGNRVKLPSHPTRYIPGWIGYSPYDGPYSGQRARYIIQSLEKILESPESESLTTTEIKNKVLSDGDEYFEALRKEAREKEWIAMGMSSPAKRKRGDSTSPTPTFGPHLQYCHIVGARVHAITLQSPPPPIQRGLKHFGLGCFKPRYEYDKKMMTCICSNCSSIAITKAYTPTKRDNIIFEGGCLKLLDINYYSDRPSGKRYYVINRRWFPVGEDGCYTLKGGYFGDGMKVFHVNDVLKHDAYVVNGPYEEERLLQYNELLKQVDHPATEQLRRLLGENGSICAHTLCDLTVVKDITTPPQSSSIYKLRQKCQSQLYLETQINLANAGLSSTINRCKDKDYYKDYFDNEEKMMKSVEFAFRELINSAELLCTYAKQLKDAAQRGEEKEEITISREDLVIKNGSYKWVTNPGMDPDGPRFKKFNATHWGSMFKDIEWYRQKEFMVSTFVKTGNGFIMKGTQWRSNNFPYETMEESFDFFSTETYASHPWHHHTTTIKKIYKDIDKIYTDLNKFCKQSFETWNVFLKPEMVKPRGYLPLDESVSDADVVLALEKASSSLYQSAKHIRALIQPMQGTYYSKSWAVQMVIKHNQSSNNSTQASVIDDMITNNRIPNTSAKLLASLVRSKKKGEFFIDDEWKTVRNNRKRGLALALVPTTFDTFSLYKPPTLIHLSNYFGTAGPDKSKSTQNKHRSNYCSRLYFSPRQFPTPVDLSQAVSCASFKCLRSYIIEQSKKEGEVSGTLARNGKSVRFACKHKKCKFYFVLKWDELGYHIHYHKYSRVDEKDLFIGCLEHSH